MSERRYGYSDDIESIVDMKDSTDGLGKELITSDVVLRLNQLDAESEALLDAANSLLGLIDCLGGGFSLDDAGPDRKRLAELVDYPNHMNKKLALLTEDTPSETPVSDVPVTPRKDE